MSESSPVSRRSLLAGAAAAAAAGVATGVSGPASAEAAARPLPPTGRAPLWKQAARKGIAFGSALATWQLEGAHRKLHARESGLLFTQDDLLWYALKPAPDAPLDFTAGDRIIGFAERHGQLTLGAHLVWDEGFGEGWTEDDLWGLNRRDASRLLYGVIRKEVAHYKGRMNGWIVATEVTDPEFHDKHGFRTNVPWYETIGPSYIEKCFHLAKEGDPSAVRIINEFGFETVNEFGDRPEPRRRVFLRALDTLLDRGAPIQAVGIQGHLIVDDFHRRFHERHYRAFLREIADRGLKILVTELDVRDDGLPKNYRKRDRKVADVYRQYLDVTLDEKAVKAVSAFGLTDRYTSLDEDFPREDGLHRRALAFDRRLRPKPAYLAISNSFKHAPKRRQLWELEKGR
jgi:endo-1,4-beta-xylanase